jgi:hypothetical protein
MNLLLKYPETFGGAACLSPFFNADTIAQARTARRNGVLTNKRIYLDIGGDMGNVKVPMFDVRDHLTPAHWWNPGYFWLDTSLQASVEAMHDALLLTTKTTRTKTTSSRRNSNSNGNNVTTTNVQYRHFPGARHNERAWSQRIHLPLLHLLGQR